jgi:hypothetical protein
LNLFAVPNLEYIPSIEMDAETVSDAPIVSEGMKHLPPPDLFDPVLEEYKKGIDVTLIVENLKRTPAERATRMGQMIDWINQLRRRREAGRLRSLPSILNDPRVESTLAAMSKAEFFQQLESLTPAELDIVATRVEELRHRAVGANLTDRERTVLEERMNRFKSDGNSGEEWSVVRERVVSKLKK